MTTPTNKPGNFLPEAQPDFSAHDDPEHASETDAGELLLQNLHNPHIVEALLSSITLLDASRTRDPNAPPTLLVKTVKGSGIPFWYTPNLDDPPTTRQALARLMLTDFKATKSHYAITSKGPYPELVKKQILQPPIAHLPHKVGKMPVWAMCQFLPQGDTLVRPPTDYWQKQAACRGFTRLFFPPLGIPKKEVKKLAGQALEKCAQCPVIRECRTYAQQNNEEVGIWGGKIFAKGIDLTAKEINDLYHLSLQQQRMRPIDAHKREQTRTLPYKKLRLTPEFYRILSAVGDHEAKGLLLLLVMKEGGYVTPPRIKKILTKNAQTVGADWIPTDAVGTTYFRRSFEPAGIVKPVQGEKWLAGYDLNPQDLIVTLALTGLLQAWSLRHPNTSLQIALGSQRGGDMLTSQARLEIWYDILTHPRLSTGMGISDIHGLSESFMASDPRTRMSRISRHLTALKQGQMIHIEHAEQENDRRYFITNPKKVMRAKARNMLKQALIEFMQDRLDYSHRDFTFNACCEFVQTWLAEENIDMPPKEISKSVRQALDKMVSVEAQGRYNQGSQSRTRITIEPAHLAAITELVSAIDAVADGDPQAISLGLACAKQIPNDKEAIRTLLNKGYLFSGSTVQSADKTTRELIEILQQTQQPTEANTLVDLYNATYKRVINSSVVTNLLRPLVDDGTLVSKYTGTKTSNRKRYFYSLPENPENQTE